MREYHYNQFYPQLLQPVYKPKLALLEWVESLREAWEQ